MSSFFSSSNIHKFWFLLFEFIRFYALKKLIFYHMPYFIKSFFLTMQINRKLWFFFLIFRLFSCFIFSIWLVVCKAAIVLIRIWIRLFSSRYISKKIKSSLENKNIRKKLWNTSRNEIWIRIRNTCYNQGLGFVFILPLRKTGSGSQLIK